MKNFQKNRRGMYLEFFHCASFKKKIIKIRSVELEIQGVDKHTDTQTHTQTDNSGEMDHPLEKQTRSARFARYTSDKDRGNIIRNIFYETLRNMILRRYHGDIINDITAP